MNAGHPFQEKRQMLPRHPADALSLADLMQVQRGVEYRARPSYALLFGLNGMNDFALAWRVEEACLNAWPSPRQVVVDRWLLRFSGGLTRRTNSVNPLRADSHESTAIIPVAQRLYHAQKQPTIFRVPSIAHGMEAPLERCGFIAEGETCTLLADLGDSSFIPDREADLTATPSANWLAAKLRLMPESDNHHQVYPVDDRCHRLAEGIRRSLRRRANRFGGIWRRPRRIVGSRVSGDRYGLAPAWLRLLYRRDADGMGATRGRQRGLSAGPSRQFRSARSLSKIGLSERVLSLSLLARAMVRVIFRRMWRAASCGQRSFEFARKPRSRRWTGSPSGKALFPNQIHFVNMVVDRSRPGPTIALRTPVQ
jgi:hypothetical protein